jgi:hypothetical protein
VAAARAGGVAHVYFWWIKARLLSKLQVDTTALAGAMPIHVSCNRWTMPSTEAMVVGDPEVTRADLEGVVAW